MATDLSEALTKITRLLNDTAAGVVDPVTSGTPTDPSSLGPNRQGQHGQQGHTGNRLLQDQIDQIIASVNAIRMDLRDSLSAARAPVAIALVDQADRIVSANAAFAQLAMRSQSDLQGRPIQDLLRDGARTATPMEPIMLYRTDGSAVPILLQLQRKRGPGGQPDRLLFATDVSDLVSVRSQLEAEIQERERIRHARDQVERVLRHDLRNPVDGIRTAANYLMNEPLDGRAQEFVRLMYEAAGRARSKIDNSLAYARMERGEYPLSRNRINLVALMRDVLHALDDTRQAYRVQLEARYRDRPLDSVYDIEVWGESDFLMDAIGNLIRNAIEAGNADEVIRVVAAEEPGAPDRESEPSVVVSVQNQRTVPSEIRERFFEPYVTQGKSAGNGLGTYTARLVARTHGGDAFMTTSEEDGTQVLIRIPRARPTLGA